jgi:hypothetical protein
MSNKIMQKYAVALSAAIDEQYAISTRNHAAVLGHQPDFLPDTRDQVATSRENFHIADKLFGECGVCDWFYKNPDAVEFGTFENCREYGLTVTVGNWTFCAYEHRNSDALCIEGCPTGEAKDYGPYGGEDKYDVLFSTNHGRYYEARKALRVAVELAKDGLSVSGIARGILQEAMAETKKEAK